MSDKRHEATAKPRLGIFGAGNLGGRLTTLASAAGYDVFVGKRDNAVSVADHSQIFIIAIPFLACASALPALAAALKGKIVVDATNPLNSDWSPVLFGDRDDLLRNRRDCALIRYAVTCDGALLKPGSGVRRR